MAQYPWRRLLKAENVTVVAPDGTVRWKGPGYFSKTKVTVDDMTADVQVGDEIRRVLPNGKDDTWLVVNPRFYDTQGSFGRHYQVELTRRGVFPHNSGGHYNISVSGPNARVNIGATDISTNISVPGELFADMRRAVEAGVSDSARRAEITAGIDAAEGASGTPSFVSAYRTLIATAADHLGVLTPFLPALSQLLR